MWKKIITFVFVLFFLFSGFLSVNKIVKADTFVPCDPNDALCNLDCELNGDVCGYWISDNDEPTCPAGQKVHPSSGNCIYDSDASCQSAFGQARYDGNEIDGCTCVDGAYYNQTTGLCEFPDICPDGQKKHPSSGNCIYDSDASCQWAFGQARYDGNEIDGCTCIDGAVYNHDTGLCEFPENCPDGQKKHPSSGNCIYDSDASCQWAFGQAYYDGNEIDGCACVEGAVYNYDTGLCEFADNCPDGMKKHSISGNCIYNSDASCEWAFGAAYYDGNEVDGCVCKSDAFYNSDTGMCEYEEGCPDGMKKHPISENCIYESDEMCRAMFGAAYYDGNEIDGCACVEGATWDGISCVSDLDIIIDTLDFTLEADGESSKNIKAWVENSQGEIVNVPMWIKIQTPNFIRPGSLDIISGKEGKGETTISAVYNAPYIDDTEKIEDADVIQDLIYVFAEINGEVTYKVITASLTTQALNFEVTLQFEKEGLIDKSIETVFNEGSLSGSVYITDKDGNQYDPNGVKVILDGVFPNADKDPIHLETVTQNGTYFFENLGKTGEFILDPIKLELNNDYQYFDKYFRNTAKFQSRVAKFGADTSFLAPYNNIVNNYVTNLSNSSYDEAKNIVNSLKMASYTAYFFEYYGRKADESLDNFVDYFSNVLVDTISFMQGIFNVTNGVFESASGESTASAKVVNQWLENKSSAKVLKMGQKALRTILQTLRKGMSTKTQSRSITMNAIQDFVGNIEQLFFAEGLNNISQYGPSQIKSMFSNYMKRSYVSDMAKVAAKYSINLNNIPDNVDSNIKRAENLFKDNTEAHDYRNALQYEWDVDTAAVNELVNVLKPAAKVGLSLYLANPVTANKVIDAMNHGYNALKVAASSNHSYEWYALYTEDFNYLEKSISILNTGQTLSYHFVLPEIIKIDNYEPKFIKVVQAAPQINESDILYNIVTAIKNDDVDSLKNYLEELDQVRESNTLARQDTVEYINDYTSVLPENKLEDANETIIANNNLDFQSETINLRLVALVNDPSEENINSFLEYVDELAKAEKELKEDNLSIYKTIENLDEKEISNTNKKETDFTASDWWGILAILNFIIGIILSIIMFKKKGKKAGFITLAVMMSLTLLLLFLTGWTYNNQIM